MIHKLHTVVTCAQQSSGCSAGLGCLVALIKPWQPPIPSFPYVCDTKYQSIRYSPLSGSWWVVDIRDIALFLAAELKLATGKCTSIFISWQEVDGEWGRCYDKRKVARLLSRCQRHSHAPVRRRSLRKSSALSWRSATYSLIYFTVCLPLA